MVVLVKEWAYQEVKYMEVVSPAPGPETCPFDTLWFKIPIPKPYRVWIYFSNFLGIGVFHWFFVRRFVEIYEQVKVPMPWATERVMEISDIMCQFPMPVVGLFLLVSIFITYTVESRFWCDVGVFLLLIGAFVMNMWGLYLPFMTVCGGISRV